MKSQDKAGNNPAKKLSFENLLAVLALVEQGLAKKDSAELAWQNDPVVKDGVWTRSTGWGEDEVVEKISAEKAAEIFKNKLDSTYYERNFLAILATVTLALSGAVEIVLVQNAEDSSSAFDPQGWVTIAVGNPGKVPDRLFHLNPSDFDLSKLDGLVHVGHQNDVSTYNKEGKVSEFTNLVRAAQMVK